MRKILILITAAILMFGCEEEKITYDGQGFVSFENPAYSMSIAAELNIPVILTTYPIDYDVKVKYNVESEDLKEGVDFSVKNGGLLVFKPGEYTKNIVIIGKKTPIVSAKSLTITLTEIDAEYGFDIKIPVASALVTKVDVTPAIVFADSDYICDVNNTWVDNINVPAGTIVKMWYSDQVHGIMSIHIEREGRSFVGKEVDGMLQIQLMKEGDVIDSTSDFTRDYGWKDNWKKMPLISNSKYTDWHGKTGYMGVEFSISGKKCFGWIKISVATDGLSARVLGWAYEANGKPIKAGQKKP